MENANLFFMTNFEDVYFICDYVKAFNSDFRLCYDTRNESYAVVNTLDGSLVLTSKEYPNFSYIEKLYMTRRENFFKLFDEIESHNEKLEKEKENNISLKSKCQLDEVISYANQNPSKEPSRNQIRKIIGEL